MVSTTSLTMFLKMMVSMSFAFLTDVEECPAPPPCHCSGSTVECYYNFERIDRVPAFRNLSSHTLNRIYLNGNSISTLPAGAFHNIKTQNYLQIYLSNNKISSINAYAFDGVEFVVSLIDLSRNNLSEIPDAISNLPNLSWLSIAGNPIVTFDALRPLGRTLHTFEFGSPVLKTWPYQLRFLRQLTELAVYGIDMSALPLEAFHGLEATLTRLVIDDTKLERIPVCVCTLRKLQYLGLFDNLMSSKHQLVPSCHSELNHVTTLDFRYNNFTSFPILFQTFPKVTDLSVLSNKHLHVIDDKLIQVNVNVTTLNLNNNGFYCVPTALLKMKHLTDLNLNGKNIMSIDAVTLNFPKLVNLKLAYNPIELVSTNALNNTKSLKHLDLSNTKLTTVPKAVVYAQSLTDVDLRYNKVECTCDLTGWLKSWLSNKSGSLNGTCYGSNETLTFFANNTCPA